MNTKFLNPKLLFQKIVVVLGLLLLLLFFSYGKSNSPAVAQTPCSTTNLEGVWNFQVNLQSGPRSPLEINNQINFLNRDGEIIGTYVNTGGARFELRAYTGRGRPIVTIAQRPQEDEPSDYRSVISGIVERDGLITGRFVDVDNNQGLVSLTKQ